METMYLIKNSNNKMKKHWRRNKKAHKMLPNLLLSNMTEHKEEVPVFK